MLDREAIAEDLAPALAMFDVKERIFAAGDAEAGRERLDKCCQATAALARERPEFFSNFDYEWALDPSSYADDSEAWLQHEALVVLSQLSPEHPSLKSHRPTVVKLLETIDMASTNVRGAQCDHILISRPHFSLLREVVVLLRELHDRASIAAPAGELLPVNWIGEAVGRLMGDGIAQTAELLAPLQRHAIQLNQGLLPTDPPTLGPWLRAGARKNDALAWEINFTYLGVDRFLLFHELGHSLEGHLHTSPRDMGRELDADRAAISLMISRIGGFDIEAPWAFGMPVLEEFIFGPPLYLHLLRLNALFVGAYRTAGMLTDTEFAPGDQAVEAAGKAIGELEIRLGALVLALSKFGLGEVADRVHERINSLHSLYGAACAKLLLDAERSFEVGDLPGFAVPNEAIDRVLSGRPGRDRP